MGNSARHRCAIAPFTDIAQRFESLHCGFPRCNLILEYSRRENGSRESVIGFEKSNFRIDFTYRAIQFGVERPLGVGQIRPVFVH